MMLVLPYAPSGIQGWSLNNELRFLYDESIRLLDAHIPGDLLEVGCWLGRSTYPLALTGHVDVVDTFCGSFEIHPSDRPRDQARTFGENMTRLGVGHRVTAYQGRSCDWLPVLPGPYRLIFVDGAHDYETVHGDLTQARCLLSPGGTLVVDDINPVFPGVQRAVRDVLANEVAEVGKMGVWRCPKVGATGSQPKRTDKLVTLPTRSGRGG